jgi:hypothetical protein
LRSSFVEPVIDLEVNFAFLGEAFGVGIEFYQLWKNEAEGQYAEFTSVCSAPLSDPGKSHQPGRCAWTTVIRFASTTVDRLAETVLAPLVSVPEISANTG